MPGGRPYVNILTYRPDVKPSDDPATDEVDNSEPGRDHRKGARPVGQCPPIGVQRLVPYWSPTFALVTVGLRDFLRVERRGARGANSSD